MNVAIRLIIWLESHESSRMIAHFREHFFRIITVLQVYHFHGNLVTYNETMRRFPNFLIFFEFFMPVSKCGQNGGNDRSQLVVESWKTFDVSLIKQILMYLEMIFVKNKEQTIRQLQFKFDPFPTKSAEICLFHQRWIKTFYTQPFCQLCI